MDLETYVDHERGRQSQLARVLNVDPQLVWQWARGVKPVPVPRCCPIEIATGGDVMRWDLRPNDWHAIWPELRKHKNAPALKVAA